MSLNLVEKIKELTDKTQLCVAYSGGIDSHVLLHALSHLEGYKIRAVHVNHGLSPNANDWESHCQRICQKLATPFQAFRLQIKKKPQHSLEAMAREARYNCLREALKSNEVLLTAHNADDQAETFLLQLMRGSGIDGLAAMPEKKSFGNSELVRPLLKIDRKTIKAYATQHHLQWVEDESNQHLEFDRNYLRHSVMPLLKKRWPSALQTINRSATHCADAKNSIAAISITDFHSVIDKNRINLINLKSLSLPRQQQVLRYWIKNHGFSLPTQQQLNVLFKTVIHSRFDATPCFRWKNQQVRRYRHLLYLTAPSTVDYGKITQPWNGEDYLIIEGIGTLALPRNLNHSKLKFPCQIRFRRGGERIKLEGHTRTLKQLFQQWQIPPWERDRIPLLYHEEILIAVIGYAISDPYNKKIIDQHTPEC